MKRRFLILTLALISAFGMPFASARPVQMWSLQELTQKADVIVIATVVSSADAKNHQYPDPKPTTEVAVDSIFEIQTTLKGEQATGSLTLRHKRYHDKKAEIDVVDGPSFVEFSAKLKNQYLMFLKRNKDGYFEPVTGQYDPYQSFHLLQGYHIVKEREQTGKTER